MKKNFLLWGIFILLFVVIIFLVIPGKTLKEIGQEDRAYCTTEQRNAEACIQIYKPVCGHVNVECITGPCNPVFETFPNSCFACLNERVEYYVEGECQ